MDSGAGQHLRSSQELWILVAIMPRYSIALILISLLSAGCASHKQLNSLQASHADLTRQLARQSEQIQMQDAYLRHLEDEHAALAQQLQALKSPPPEAQAEAAKPPTAAKPKPRPPRAVTNADGQLILGRSEWVWFDLFKRDLPVAVDAERKFSLLSVINTQAFERDGNDWVRYKVQLPGGRGEQPQIKELESPVVRTVKLRSGDPEDVQPRPVVRLTVKIGRLVEEVQFALVEEAEPAVLATLGRAFLRDIAVVDNNRTFIQPKHSSR